MAIRVRKEDPLRIENALEVSLNAPNAQAQEINSAAHDAQSALDDQKLGDKKHVGQRQIKGQVKGSALPLQQKNDQSHSSTAAQDVLNAEPLKKLSAIQKLIQEATEKRISEQEISLHRVSGSESQTENGYIENNNRAALENDAPQQLKSKDSASPKSDAAIIQTIVSTTEANTPSREMAEQEKRIAPEKHEEPEKKTIKPNALQKFWSFLRQENRMKIISMAALWMFLGILVVLYAGTLVYANFIRIEVDAAVITGAIESVNAPNTGKIQAMVQEKGTFLAKGERIIQVEDADLERQISQASIELDRSRDALKQSEAEFAAEKSMRDQYNSLIKARTDKIKAEIESLEDQLVTARDRKARMLDLYQKGLTTKPRLEEAIEIYARVNASLKQAELSAIEQKTFNTVGGTGLYFNGISLSTRVNESEAKAARAKSEVTLASEQLAIWMERRAKTQVHASTRTRLIRPLRFEGSIVKQGDPVALVERLDERYIYAYLTQDEITKVKIGDKATVYVPGYKVKTEAEIAQIERSSGFIDDVEIRYFYYLMRDTGLRSNDRDRTARVLLKFTNIDQPTARSAFELGTPVVISFQKHSTNSVLASFESLKNHTGLQKLEAE